MNYQIVDALNDLSGHFAPLDDVMIFCAKYLIYLLIVAFVAVLVPVLRRRDWPTLVQVGATLAVSYLLGLLAANLYAERRPFTAHHDINLLIAHAPGQSFPSDHATASFAMAFAILLFVSRKWGWTFFVTAVVIGVSRVYVGLHYLGDIGGSLACVLVAAGIVVLASGLVTRLRSSRPSAELRET